MKPELFRVEKNESEANREAEQAVLAKVKCSPEAVKDSAGGEAGAEGEGNTRLPPDLPERMNLFMYGGKLNCR